MSKNKPTIRQLKLACRQIKELEDADMTENLAIRLLELLADLYAKTHTGGTASADHVMRVPRAQWSLAALRANNKRPNAKAGTYLRIEHGTPKRDLARKVRKLYQTRRLTPRNMAALVRKFWKVVVLTHEEDARLSRQLKFKTPQQRWAAAGIPFPKNSPNALK